MQLRSWTATALLLVSALADVNASAATHQVLSAYRPPQHWRNNNLVRSINLEKSYPREYVNVVIENISPEVQDEYYIPFDTNQAGSVGSLEVKDKKLAGSAPFVVDLLGNDGLSSTQMYRVRLPKPLAPSEQQTLTISYAVLSALEPLPTAIAQADKQYLTYSFNAYLPSVYNTLKQKTKLKFPNDDVQSYTPLSSADGTDAERLGSGLTYGPFNELPAGSSSPVTVRYEFTKPVPHATLLERDIEISHWGGNLATEERYWLTNHAAELKSQFSRVEWQRSAYFKPPSSAMEWIQMPLKIGSTDPYFTDDIGNVSTSRFRSNLAEANLELKPRYPVFGKWNYKFRVGWDRDLKSALRKMKTGDSYVLNVPFLEGLKPAEGMSYERVQLRVILPEGAKNVKYETSVPLISSETSIHRTFMDTTGRTTLELTAVNLVDEFRDRDLIITYDYAFSAGFTKPITITLAVFSVFAAAWLLGKVDVSIGSKKKI